MYELNRLIEKVTMIQAQLSENSNNDLLSESLELHVTMLNRKYGIYLNDLLFELYDEYCEDNEIQRIENYLSPNGVSVEADDFPGVHYQLKLKAFPLRFELENHVGNFNEVLWRAA